MRYLLLNFFLCINFLIHADSASIRLNQEIINVELAQNASERMIGLMGRSSLEDGCGMLFIYEKPQKLSFWMKNTRVPLDIGFFDAGRRLIQIEHMDVPSQEKCPTYHCPKLAQYALEVPQGWFERHKIDLMTRFEWEKTSQ